MKTVTARGSAEIQGGGTGRARELALEDALRSAVEQAGGVQVASETIVEKAQLAADTVQTVASAYVQSYTILSAYEKNNQYQVEILASVSSGNLPDTAKARELLLIARQQPKVLFRITMQERAAGATAVLAADAGPAAAAMAGVFREKGFSVTDEAAGAQSEPSGSGGSAVRPPGRAPAQGSSAEVVIEGSASVQEQSCSLDPAIKTYQCCLSVKALRTDDRQVIAAESQCAPAAHIEPGAGVAEALKKAGSRVAAALADKLLALYQGQALQGNLVRVRITGVRGYDDVVKARQFIHAHGQGIKKLYQRSMAPGEAVFEAALSGTVEQLADGLASGKSADVVVTVTGQTANTLTVALTH